MGFECLLRLFAIRNIRSGSNHHYWFTDHLGLLTASKLNPPNLSIRSSNPSYIMKFAARFQRLTKRCSELLGAFHADIETATGLRVGRVDSELSSATSLQGAARQPVHFTEIIPNMTLTYARKLHEERRAAPCSITFFGLNFVNEGALRFVRPETWLIGGNWWLFPPLQVSVGQYHWPAERISQDDATNLFLGAALSSALDDIVHGAGPLTKSHLPEAILHDTAERKAINQELQEFTGLPLAW